MKLTNESRWDTDDLRAFVRACAKAASVSLADTEVIFRTGRNEQGPINFGVVRDSVPKRRFVKIRLLIPARIVQKHMIETIGGLRDADRVTLPTKSLRVLAGKVEWAIKYFATGDRKHSVLTPDKLPEWAAGLVVREAAKPEKTGRVVGAPLQRERLARAEGLLADWQKKRKHADRFVKKYEREVKRRKKALRDLDPMSKFPGYTGS